MSSRKSKLRLPQADDHLDLVPLIDCVFLILLFFILCGRISTDQRTEQITVPPTKSAMKIVNEWPRVVINIHGSTKHGAPPRNSIGIIGEPIWIAEGDQNFTSYQKLRETLNRIYDKADKLDDPKGTGLKLPKVIVELRADADTEYRVVQEVQQILSDTVDPFNAMKPKAGTPATQKPFINIDFTARRTDGK